MNVVTAEEQAIAKVRQASSACYPFPAPIEDSSGGSESTSPSGPDSFTLTVTTNLLTGGTQVFQWDVDRSTLAFTPLNDLARGREQPLQPAALRVRA